MADDNAQVYRNRHSSAVKQPAVADDIVTQLRHVSWLAEEGSAVVDLAACAADEIMRTREQIDVLKIELAQARTGRALLEVERLQAENDELRRRLAEGFATSVVIDVSHEDAARKLRQVMRTIEALTEGNEQ